MQLRLPGGSSLYWAESSSQEAHNYMAVYTKDDRSRRRPAHERGTLAHFGGCEGIHPDDVERDDRPPSKRPSAGRYAARDFGEDQGVHRGRTAPRCADENDWHRGMRGQATGGYGGQYAGMAAGLRGSGRATRPDPAEMVGSYGESGRTHRGRGPKGYVRRDERIHEEVCERLKCDDVLDATDIAVHVRAGVVTLDGTVMRGWAKRRAADLAM